MKQSGRPSLLMLSLLFWNPAIMLVGLLFIRIHATKFRPLCQCHREHPDLANRLCCYSPPLLSRWLWWLFILIPIFAMLASRMLLHVACLVLGTAFSSDPMGDSTPPLSTTWPIS
jgi:hypothetical protein